MTRFPSVMLMLLVSAGLALGGQTASAGAAQAAVPIKLRLHVDQHPAIVTVLNGGLARIEVRNRGTYGLVPMVHGDGDGVVLALMVIAVDPDTGKDAVRGIGSMSLAVGSVQTSVLGDVPLDVELLEIAPPQPAPPAPAGPCLSCCVTCGEQTVCGCYVELECSRCCCAAGGCGCIPDNPAPSCDGKGSGSVAPRNSRGRHSSGMEQWETKQ